MRAIRLGVNIDHVATIRNARGGRHPDPLRAAQLAVESGADGITAHLREDRRHIGDEDIARLKAELKCPLNLEMAPTAEMQAIALKHLPHACCLVPERRAERTTERGLDIRIFGNSLTDYIARLRDSGIRISLFIDADASQIDAAKHAGGDIVELHTGTYCEAALRGDTEKLKVELARLAQAAYHADNIGLEVHAGHGLTFDTVAPIAELPEIVELNIGHFLIGEAVFSGLHSAVKRMKLLMERSRSAAAGAQSA